MTESRQAEAPESAVRVDVGRSGGILQIQMGYPFDGPDSGALGLPRSSLGVNGALQFPATTVTNRPSPDPVYPEPFDPAHGRLPSKGLYIEVSGGNHLFQAITCLMAVFKIRSAWPETNASVGSYPPSWKDLSKVM